MSLADIISSMVPTTKEERLETAKRRQVNYQNYKPKAYVREYKYRARLRKEMIAAYGGKCSCCNETDPVVLVLDHINDDAPVDRIINNHKGGYRMYADLRRRGWPKDNHQLLCHNCNFRKEYYRRNPNALKES